jgi:hypothetical protein
MTQCIASHRSDALWRKCHASHSTFHIGKKIGVGTRPEKLPQTQTGESVLRGADAHAVKHVLITVYLQTHVGFVGKAEFNPASAKFVVQLVENGSIAASSNG